MILGKDCSECVELIAPIASNNTNTRPGRTGEDVGPAPMVSLDEQQTEDVCNTYETKLREDISEEETEQGYVDFDDHPSGGDDRLAHQQKADGKQLHTRLREEEILQIEHDCPTTKLVDYDDYEVEVVLVSEKLVDPATECPASTSEKQTPQITEDQEEGTDDEEKEDDVPMTGDQATGIGAEEERDNTSIGGNKPSKRRGQWEDGPLRGPKALKLKHNQSVTIRRPRTKSKKSSKKQRETPTAVSRWTKLKDSDIQDEVQEWPGPLPTDMDADSKTWYFTEAMITLDLNDIPNKIEEKQEWRMADAMGNWHTYRPALHVGISFTQSSFLTVYFYSTSQ